MSQEINAAHIAGLAGITVTVYDLTGTVIPGYASPNIQSLKISHSVDKVVTKNQDGDEASTTLFNEKLMMTLDWIPQGSNKTEAKVSASTPPAGARVKISGAPVVRKGWLSDAVNGDAEYPWMYEGDSSDDWKCDGIAGMSFPIVRKKGMPTYNVISNT